MKSDQSLQIESVLCKYWIRSSGNCNCDFYKDWDKCRKRIFTDPIKLFIDYSKENRIVNSVKRTSNTSYWIFQQVCLPEHQLHVLVITIIFKFSYLYALRNYSNCKKFWVLGFSEQWSDIVIFLLAKNKFTAIWALAVAVIQYTLGIIIWRIDKPRRLDDETRKLLTAHRVLQLRALFVARRNCGSSWNLQPDSFLFRDSRRGHLMKIYSEHDRNFKNYSTTKQAIISAKSLFS